MAGVIRNPHDNPTDNPLVSHEMPSSFWLFGKALASNSDAYTIVASPRLRSAPSYIRAEARKLLPAQIEYAPAIEAIAWYRAHIYKR